MMEHPLFSNTLRRLIALKAHTEEATVINCSIHWIISSHSCQLTAFKTGCMQSYQEEAVAVKEWYQNQDVPDADNVTPCFWAIPYKFSTWWSIKYKSKHLEKDACLKTLSLFLVSEGKKTISTFFSALGFNYCRFCVIQGVKSHYPDTFQSFFNEHYQGKSVVPFMTPHL